MMYKVVYMSNSIERILFRSYVESECWNFIQTRRNCFIPKIRDEAKYYVVLDSLNQVHEFPYSKQAA